jgi:hypothetical protein
MNTYELQGRCSKMIKERGMYPGNESLPTFNHYLGDEWGPVFKDFYSGHPKARLRVPSGVEMLTGVFENVLKESTSLRSPSSPAS